MTKIIAEIGWNHMGKLELAKKMILSAKNNGADYVKTQIFDIKSLKPGPWNHDGRLKIYQKAQLNFKQQSIVLFLTLFSLPLKTLILFFLAIFKILSSILFFDVAITIFFLGKIYKHLFRTISKTLKFPILSKPLFFSLFEFNLIKIIKYKFINLIIFY